VLAILDEDGMRQGVDDLLKDPARIRLSRKRHHGHSLPSMSFVLRSAD
jgi:hypothetical protein